MAPPLLIEKITRLGFKGLMPILRWIFALLTLLLLPSCSRVTGQTLLAQVEGEKIFTSDLMRVFQEHADDYGPDLLADPEGSLVVKQKLLMSLIEETLLTQMAREKKITLTNEEEKKLVDHLQSGFAGGEFESLLKERQVDPKEWIERQKNKKIIEKFVAQEVLSKIEVTPEEIANHYRKYQSLFREPDRVHCRHIVAAKKEKAQTIRSLLEKGENFIAVAQKYSESPDRENGGDLGFIARGDYSGLFEQACFTLATGQTSDVIPSEYGFHIFRVIDKKPGRPLSLQEATGQIESRFREARSKAALRTWLERVNREKKITIDEEALKAVVLPLPRPETQNSDRGEDPRP